MNPADLPSIEKRRSAQDGLDFDGLRRTGIDLLQEMCGREWTDYNLHDPGVTLLESLCFGLTDLVYRTGFATEDYLAGPDGRIDGAGMALLPPEQALSSDALTCRDYQKLLADALPQVRNVWVGKSARGLPGLLDIQLQPADDAHAGSAAAAAVRRQAADIYLRHRNLGEDLGEIVIVDALDYRLAGTVEIEGGRSAAEILADIYFACDAAISPPLPQQPFRSLADRPPDTIFDGPYTPHGYIDGDAFDAWGGATLSELVLAVGRVRGVHRVDALELLDTAGRSCQAAVGTRAARRVPRLAVPDHAAGLLLRLRCAGQERSVALADFHNRLRRLQFAADPRRHGRYTAPPSPPLPMGQAPAIADYTPVQHHLPPVYGVSDYGIPLSSTPERRALAKQLQAYLLLFDQLMANFLQNLQELHRLFSLDPRLERSYFHQVLTDVPAADVLYLGGRAGMDAGLRAALAAIDDFGDRRSRTLDFLLALHGEKFTQSSLRHFSTGDGKTVEHALIDAKIAFAAAANGINARRMGACDYRRHLDAHNAAGAAQKLALLVGLNTTGRHPVTVALRARGFRHLADRDFRRLDGLVFAAIPPDSFAAVPLDVAAANLAAGRADAAFIALGVLCPALMDTGSHLARYRVAAAEAGWTLYFDLGAPDGGLVLSTHPDKQGAVAAANRVCRFVAELVTKTLTFHVVEHLLLRPAAGEAAAQDAEFFTSRASAVFPAWSARLGDPEFRKLVEETLSLCAPAHISIDPVWLDFDQMAEFERLYWDWQRRMREPAATPARAAAARALAGFLRQHHERTAPIRWR